MAQKGIKQAIEEQRLDLERWANGMITQLKRRFSTQHTWPMGYPGPYRLYKLKGKSKSTGDSFKSLYTQVYNGASGDTEKISFFFLEYLYFVDMGVGAGQPIEKVDNAAYAKWNKLYKTWKGEGDRQSRPQLTMEIRHQLKRLTSLLVSYYGEAIESGIVFSLGNKGEQAK